MRRFALIATFAALLVGVVAMPGSAASFDDTTPCPAEGPLLVCPAAYVGQPYSLQLRALAGCDIYRWEITNGGLPAGLTLSSSGLVSGTPTSSGATQPWVTVHDLTAPEGGNSWCGGDNHSERQFVFTSVPGLSIQNQSVPGGTVGQPYSVTFTALTVTNTNPIQGSPAAATWSVQSGDLPAGVSLSPQGQLTGTPTSEGTYTFVVKAQGGGGVSDTETETLVVRQPISVTSAFAQRPAPKAEVGVPFTAQQTAAGGEGTFTWSIAEGALPAGLALAPEGTVSGTPTLAGRFVFTLAVTDRESRTARVNVILVVAPKLAITTLKLLPAKVGRAYRGKVAKVGGVAPTVWTVRGKLPKGLKFAPKLVLFLGTPTQKGKFRVTVQALDALGVKAQKTLTITVAA